MKPCICGAKSGEGSSSPLQTLTYYGQTLLRYQAVDGILLGKSILLASTSKINLFSCVGELGFEPRLTESESAVLPIERFPKLFRFQARKFTWFKIPIK